MWKPKNRSVWISVLCRHKFHLLQINSSEIIWGCCRFVSRLFLTLNSVIMLGIMMIKNFFKNVYIKCVYGSWGVLLHMWKSSIKPSVAPEEAACNLINSLQWCHSVAKLHCGQYRQQVLKPVRWISISLLTHWWTHYERFLFFDTDITSLYHTFLSVFKTWHLHYPQCILPTEWHQPRQLTTLCINFCFVVCLSVSAQKSWP